MKLTSRRRHQLADLAGRRVLLVASTGGHLNQLCRLAPRLGVHPDSLWVTFDTPQSRSLLQGRPTHFVDYVKPRDWVGILRVMRSVRPFVPRYEGAVSTGAGVALGVLPMMLLSRRPTVYIESVSRVHGPSVTGGLLSRLPRIGLYTQHPSAAYPGWSPGPSVLSAYRAEPAAAPATLRRLFVTLGTIAPYRCDRIIDLVLAHLARHPEVEVLWQVGVTDRTGLPGRVVTQLGEQEFADALHWADVVVAHAGVGVAMNILDSGKPPLLVARRQHLGEHVDDHQLQIRDHLVERGLAFDAEQALGDDALLARVVAAAIVPEPGSG